MKKLLLTSVAVSGLAFAAAPAHAELELDAGGYFKGYFAYVDQDEAGTAEVNSFDIIRDTEVHFGGETTLDNGLTVGVHIEADADGADGFGVDESYLYMSGGWGRVNVGAEDGAAYLLQVAAPSADSNIDGIRQFVQPVNYDVALGAGTADDFVNFNQIDYDQDPSGKSDKLTYLSPILNGFQAGLTFSPDTDSADDLEGIGSDNVENAFGRTYEAAVRYEGQFNTVGVIVGAGYSFSELEAEEAGGPDSAEPTDDRQAWNVGLDLDIGPFGIGAAYLNDDHGSLDSVNGVAQDTVAEEDTFVVGADYTTGPFVIGASYLNSDYDDVVDIDRYSGGVTYEYGPGMTFRGSIAYVNADIDGADEVDATSIVLGTQVNF